MPRVTTNIEIVQGALGAARAGDASSFDTHIAEDFVWHIPGTSSISGDAIGAAAWSEKLSRLIGAGLQPQLLSMLEGPDHVAVLQRNTADVDGHRLDVQVVNLFTITAGKVARLDTFFSDQPAAEAFWNAVL